MEFRLKAVSCFFIFFLLSITKVFSVTENEIEGFWSVRKTSEGYEFYRTREKFCPDSCSVESIEEETMAVKFSCSRFRSSDHISINGETKISFQPTPICYEIKRCLDKNRFSNLKDSFFIKGDSVAGVNLGKSCEDGMKIVQSRIKYRNLVNSYYDGYIKWFIDKK